MVQPQQSFHSSWDASIQLFSNGQETKDGEPIFMTSSIIRGNVNLMLHEPRHCHSLRLIFHASESLPQRTIGAGVTQSRHQQFFGTQNSLLERQDLYTGQHDFAFGFQLPHVQYPPSMEHDLSRYGCRFKLTLYLDKDIIATKEVTYRPLIEMRLLHIPLVKVFRVAKRSYSAKLHALDYLPGDTISLGLRSNATEDHLFQTLLLIQVVQTATLLNQPDKTVGPLVDTVASSSDFKQASPHDSTDYRNVMTLRLPSSLPPSFSYGNVIAVSYRLQLVARSQKNTLWSTIKGSDTPLFDIPITIGTVSYDMDAPMETIQVYTVFSSVFGSPDSPRPSSGRTTSSLSSSASLPEMPVPRSIPLVSSHLNYDESNELPPYSMLQLPDYEEAMKSQQEEA